MNEAGKATQSRGGSGKLAAAMRDIKNAAADRADVVVELRDGQLARLEMLAEELRQVFADVPADDERFDFAISSGMQPRLWIDAVAHVTMGRDRRTYRFLRDTRVGRVVLAEGTEIAPIAERVTTYIAERLVEREQALSGEVHEFHSRPATTPTVDAGPASATEGGGIGRAVAVLMLGALFGILVTLAFGWQRIAELGIPFR